jgi:hypothetical protein
MKSQTLGEILKEKDADFVSVVKKEGTTTHVKGNSVNEDTVVELGDKVFVRKGKKLTEETM